jgi:hypothetical protein
MCDAEAQALGCCLPYTAGAIAEQGFASPQAAEVVEVVEEAEEEEEEACTPTVRVATFAAGDSPLEAGLDYFRHAV